MNFLSSLKDPWKCWAWGELGVKPLPWILIVISSPSTVTSAVEDEPLLLPMVSSSFIE